MAIFSEKIIEAHYIDLEYSLIEIIYEGEDGKLYSYALKVDPDNKDYQDLLADGWDLDKLVDDTAEYKRRTSAHFNTEVNAAAKMLVDGIFTNKLENLDRDTRLKVQHTIAEVWAYIHQNNKDKDMLFKFKLWVLEQDFMQSASKEEKSAIRKATRVTQIFGLIDKLLEE